MLHTAFRYALMLCLVLGLSAGVAFAQDNPTDIPDADAPTNTPEEAVEAYFEALQAQDIEAVTETLHPDDRDQVQALSMAIAMIEVQDFEVGTARINEKEATARVPAIQKMAVMGQVNEDVQWMDCALVDNTWYVRFANLMQRAQTPRLDEEQQKMLAEAAGTVGLFFEFWMDIAGHRAGLLFARKTTGRGAELNLMFFRNPLINVEIGEPKEIVESKNVTVDVKIEPMNGRELPEELAVYQQFELTNKDGMWLIVTADDGEGEDAEGQDTPDAVVEKFFQAWKDKDRDAMLACTAPEARDRAGMTLSALMFSTLKAYEVAEITTDGDTGEASVTITLAVFGQEQEREQSFQLVKVDGVWYMQLG